MAVSETSLMAFKEYLSTGALKTHKEKVMGCIHRFGALSREEIADITGIKLSSVGRPVMELVQEGVLVESVSGVSQTSGHVVKIVGFPAEEQMGLF